LTLQEKIIRTQMEICSKVLRSGYYDKLETPLDLRINIEDVHEDVLRLRQLQDLEFDIKRYGSFEVQDI
jgi:hypothetical protein